MSFQKRHFLLFLLKLLLYHQFLVLICKYFLKGVNVWTDRRHDRRAMEVEEIRRLLEMTTSDPERYGMTGAERAML